MLAFSWYTYLTLRPSSTNQLTSFSQSISPPLDTSGAHLWQEALARLLDSLDLRVFYEFKSNASWIMIDKFSLDILSSGHFCSLICRKGCIEQKKNKRTVTTLKLCYARNDLKKHQILGQSKNFEKWQRGQKWFYLWTKL